MKILNDLINNYRIYDKKLISFQEVAENKEFIKVIQKCIGRYPGRKNYPKYQYDVVIGLPKQYDYEIVNNSIIIIGQSIYNGMNKAKKIKQGRGYDLYFENGYIYRNSGHSFWGKTAHSAHQKSIKFYEE